MNAFMMLRWVELGVSGIEKLSDLESGVHDLTGRERTRERAANYAV